MLATKQLSDFSVAVRESTLKRLKAIPIESEGFRIKSKSLSVIEIAQHLVDCDYSMIQGIKSNERDACLPSKDLPDSLKLTDVITELEHTLQLKLDLINSLSESDLSKTVSATLNDGSQQIPVWWLILRVNLDHEIHHRGQLALYLEHLTDKE